MHFPFPPSLLTEGPLDIHPEMLQRLLRCHLRLPRRLPDDEEPCRPSPGLSVPRDLHQDVCHAILTGCVVELELSFRTG